MPTNRTYRPRGLRPQLSPGQRLFLAGVDPRTPGLDYGNSGNPYAESMIHSHLCSSWRNDPPPFGPIDQPTAKELWGRYGREAVDAWDAEHPDGPPHPATARFTTPP